MYRGTWEGSRGTEMKTGLEVGGGRPGEGTEGKEKPRGTSLTVCQGPGGQGQELRGSVPTGYSVGWKSPCGTIFVGIVPAYGVGTSRVLVLCVCIYWTTSSLVLTPTIHRQGCVDKRGAQGWVAGGGATGRS